MKKFFLFFCLLFITTFLVGCFEKPVTISSIEVTGLQENYDENFQLADLTVTVKMSDGTTSTVPLSESMITPTDLAKFNSIGTHTINVSYLAAATSFSITITGEKGDDGREVTFQVADGFVQWKYVGDATWTNLIALSVLTGPAGISGTNGKEAEFQVSTTHIQWRYVGDATWKDLIAIATLVGPAGPAGTNGTNGTNGREVEFQVSPTHIQWRYVGDTNWTNLVALETLKGTTAPAPVITISEDGYWVIDGVKTDKLAVIVKPKLTVTFDPNGGNLPEGFDPVLTNVEKGDSIDLPIPTKDGYIFKGWFTGDTVNDAQFTVLSTVTKNLTLYAKWELDIEVIKAFFNVFQTTNYTMDLQATISSIYDNKELSILHMINQVDNEIHQVIINTVSFSEDEEVYTETEENYNLYRNHTIYNIRKYSDDYLEFDYHFGTYVFEFDLGLIDYSKFTKRDDSNIYDYNGELNISDFFDKSLKSPIPFEEEFNLDFYLDLDLNMIYATITVMEYDYYNDEYFESTINATIELTAVGTTTIEVPINLGKEALLQMVDQNVADNEYNLTVSYDYCVNNYFALVSAIETAINQSQSFQDLAACNDMLWDLYDFYFEYDEFKLYKYEILIQVESWFNMLSLTATSESILEMKIVLDNYIIQIEQATTFDELQMIFSCYKSDINKKFVEDPEKRLLIDYKDNIFEKIEIMEEMLSQMLANPFDEEYIYDITYSYSWDIYEALTIEQIDTLFDAMISELNNLNLVFNAEYVDEFKGMVKNMFFNLYNSYRQFLAFDESVYYEFFNLYDIMKTEENMVYYFDLVYDEITRLEKFIISSVKNKEYLEVDEIYNKYLSICDESSISLLINLYDSAKNEIDYYENNNLDGLYYLNNISYNLENNCYNYLMLNTFLYELNNKVDQLNSLFEYRSIVATDDSIQQMGALLDNHTILIKASKTDGELIANYDAAVLAIENAFVFDPVKQEVINYRNEILYEMNSYIQFIMMFLKEEYYNNSLMFYSDIYLNSITFATSKEHIDNIHNSFKNNIVLFDLDLDLTILTEVINSSILPYLEACYKEKLMQYGYNEAAENVYLNTVTYIKNSTDIFQIYNSIENMFLDLEEIYVQIVITETLELLESVYQKYLNIVLLDSITLLNDTYNQSIQLITSANSIDEVENLYCDFIDFCNTLPLDPLKLAKNNAIDYLKFEFSILSETATEDSIAAMSLVLADYITLISICLTENEVNDQSNAGFQALNAAYVLDTYKAALIEKINKTLIKMGDLNYYLGTCMYPDGPGIDLLQQLFNQYKDLILKATTIEGVTDLYNLWYSEIATLDSYLDYSNFYYNQDNFVNYLLMLFNNLLSYFEIPQNITEDFHNRIFEIKQTTTYLSMFEKSISCYEFIFETEYLFAKQTVLADLEENYLYYKSIIIDEQLPLLDSKYFDAKEKIQTALQSYDMYYYLNSFLDYCEFELTIDSLKVLRFEYANSFINEYNYYCKSATTASITAMTLIKDNFLVALENTTTYEEMDTLYGEYINYLNEAYLADPHIYYLDLAKNFYSSKLNNYSYFISSYNQDYTYTEKAYGLVNSYNKMIYEQTTVQGVKDVYVLGMNQISSLPYTIDPNVVNMVFADMYYYLDQLYFAEDYYVGDKPEQAVLDFYLFLKNFTLETNPFVAYKNKELFIDGYYDQLAVVLKQNIIFNLNQHHEYALATLSLEDIGLFSDKHNYYLDRLNYCFDFGTLINFYYEYQFWFYSLPFDNFESIRYNILSYIEIDYKEKCITALDSDLLALNDLKVNYEGLIAAAITEEEIFNIYNSWLDEIGLFVPDEVKLTLRSEIINEANTLSIDFNLISSFINDYEKELLNTIFIAYYDNITNSLTVEEAHNYYLAALNKFNYYANVEEEDFTNYVLSIFDLITNLYISFEPTTELDNYYDQTFSNIACSYYILEVYHYYLDFQKFCANL